MQRIKNCLKWCAFLFVVGVIVLGSGLVYLAKTRKPDLDRTVSHPFLKSEVRVIRDDWGVPHIEAQYETDASFALGYVMGQDRLFQLEMVLRLAKGELAELLGPPLVPIDKLARSFRLREIAEATISRPGLVVPEARAAAEAYVAGLNYCVETEPLPFEFAVLGIPKRTYTLVDCITITGILPLSFSDGMRGDPLYTILKERLPDMDVASLFPGYSKEAPVTIMETLEEAKAYLESNAQNPVSPTASAPAEARTEALERVLSALTGLNRLFGPALGSNSWVLSGSRTKSGKPIMANDPHIGFTNPGVWYEAHLIFPGYDLYGYYLPLIPFALLGHNRHHAWGITMFENDDVDLFRETFDPQNPDRVMYKGEWADVKKREELIRVRFGQDQKHTVRSTPHGPVITDFFRRISGYEGADVALSWTWQQVDYTDISAFYEMGHARDLDAFEKGVSKITSPGLNISYADADGNIAWWAAGLITIRSPQTNHKALLDGASGRDEILGYVQFADNPQLKNPECGYIVTANNMSTVKPLGGGVPLQGYWQPSDRAARLEYLLDQRNDWDLESLKAVQFDDTSPTAPDIVAVVLDAVRSRESTFSAVERDALKALEGWDFRHNVESTGACIYQTFIGAVLRDLYEDEMGEKGFDGYRTVADHWNALKAVMKDESSAFWDDIRTTGKETRTDTITKSFREAVGTLCKLIGNDVSGWRWGNIHKMEFKHPFGYVPGLGRIFNVGPFASSGGPQLVNNMLTAPGDPPYDVLAGPSTRRLIDFADPEHSLDILPTGNSGYFLSPHYDDQAEMFMKGEYREPRLTKEQIESHKKHEMRFGPAGSAR